MEQVFEAALNEEHDGDDSPSAIEFAEDEDEIWNVTIDEMGKLEDDQRESSLTILFLCI